MREVVIFVKIADIPNVIKIHTLSSYKTTKGLLKGETMDKEGVRVLAILAILTIVVIALVIWCLAMCKTSSVYNAVSEQHLEKLKANKENERKISKDMTVASTEEIRNALEKEDIIEEKETIKIKYFDDELPKIEKIDSGDWIDLRSAEEIVMDKGDFKIISLGVAMKLPEGYEAHVVPRSSTFKNFGIIQTNHCGVIDESYCGDEDVWKFPALAMKHTVIHKGDRICQFRIMQKMPLVRFEEVNKLEVTSRGGFGSTGVN